MHFLGSNVYAVSRSKYTGHTSISMQAVPSTGMLSIVLDKGKLLKIEEVLVTISILTIKPVIITYNS